MRNFDLRIKISASAQKLKVVFDFREMPWDRTDAEQTTGLLLALGNAEVEWIVGELFPELDGFELRPSPNWRGPLNDHCPKTYLLGTNRYEGAVTEKKMGKNIHLNILKDELRRLRWSQVINHYVQF